MTRNLKLIDTATGAEIALPARLKCWDGDEITVQSFFPSKFAGAEGVIVTDKNETFYPSVVGAKIIDFPLTEADANYVAGRL